MAKDDNKQGNNLLGSIVSELKQLNRANVKDKLRDAEALKRAESLAASQVMQAQESGAIVTDAQDFQRRFLAGQSRTEFNSAIKDRPAKLGQQLRLIDFASQSLITLLKINKTLSDSFKIDMEDPVRNEEFIGPPRPEIPIATAESSAAEVPGTPDVDGSLPLIKVNSDALVQISSKIKNVNHQILDFLKADKLDRLQQFNTTQRQAEEARREAIKNSGAMGGFGGAGSGTGSADGEDEGGGGVFNFLKDNAGKLIAGGAAGIWGTKKLLKHFGFGTKRGFAKTFKYRLAIYGRKLFGKKKGAGNPRMWPYLLAGSFLAAFLTQSEETLNEFDPIGDNFADVEGTADDGFSMGDAGSLAIDTAVYASAASMLKKPLNFVTRGWSSKMGTWLVQGFKHLAKGIGGRLGFFLLRALGTAAMGVAGVGAFLTAPVWAGIIAAGIVAYKWEEITNFMSDAFGAATEVEMEAAEMVGGDFEIGLDAEQNNLDALSDDPDVYEPAMKKILAEERAAEVLKENWLKKESMKKKLSLKKFKKKANQGRHTRTLADIEALSLYNSDLNDASIAAEIAEMADSDSSTLGGGTGTSSGSGVVVKEGDTTIINNETIFIIPPKDNTHKRMHLKDR